MLKCLSQTDLFTFLKELEIEEKLTMFWKFTLKSQDDVDAWNLCSYWQHVSIQKKGKQQLFEGLVWNLHKLSGKC